MAAEHVTKIVFLCALLCLLGIGGVHTARHIFLSLPGTQVGTVDSANSAGTCAQCHNSTSDTRPITIHRKWSGSMMSQSARDPIFFAALAATNKYRTGDGEFCIRCHSPMGWLAGHSEDFTGQALAGTDFDGVQCDYCHRSADPLNPDSTVPYFPLPVPGYGNGMHAVQRLNTPKRGPYDSVAAPHQTRYDKFQQSSELCGVCHDVSNPEYAQDRLTQPPHEYAPLERTYSEWLMSWYATQGDAGTCQSCHMTDTAGYVCIYPTVPYRTDIAQHDLTGGNTFVPQILPDFYGGLDTAALSEGVDRAAATLRRAAEMSVHAFHSGDSVIAIVHITNLTGHKLPTGYPDGRRMWINLIARNAQGDTVFESGAYEPDSGLLVRDPQLRLYEATHGLTAATASAFGLQPGPSFHFFLNDTIFFDNRIPPRGFTNLGFLLRRAEPVGRTYADSQYSDTARYRLPAAATTVTASLYYQTISKEYADFLRDENSGNFYDWNDWGGKLHQSWQTHGRSSPVLMKSGSTPVRDSIDGVRDDRMKPAQFALFQNYPNPFNPATRITFSLRRSAFVTLKVYDPLGREVATLVNGTENEGTHSVEWHAGSVPSGIYLYRLVAREIAVTAAKLFMDQKKMVLLR
jgi:cytochrome c554/c'-like protein